MQPCSGPLDIRGGYRTPAVDKQAGILSGWSSTKVEKTPQPKQAPAMSLLDCVATFKFQEAQALPSQTRQRSRSAFLLRIGEPDATDAATRSAALTLALAVDRLLCGGTFRQGGRNPGSTSAPYFRAPR